MTTTEKTFLVGLDLGQAADPSALAVLERTETRGEGLKAERTYACVALKRWALGTSYVGIVDDLKGLIEGNGRLAQCHLIVDASGVGRPVVDLLRNAKLPVAKIVPVIITAGYNQSMAPDGYRHVAKSILIHNMKLLMEQQRLKFAKALKETKTLVRELENYRTKITPAANETWSAREGCHDDLLLAVAIATWFGEKAMRRFHLWLDGEIFRP
jgi:hypothetical protein